MQATLRPWLTAGLALAGAGVVAVIPVAASTHAARAFDVQLTADPSGTPDTSDPWQDLATNTQNNITALTASDGIQQWLTEGAPLGAPDWETLLRHAFDYPLHNLTTVLQNQFELLLADLTNPQAFFIDLLNAPAIELDAVLNGAGLEAADGGLRGLLNPIHIPTGEDGDTVSQLGTFSNLAAVIGDLTHGDGLGGLLGGSDFGL